MRSIYRSKDHADIIEKLLKKNQDTGVAVFPTIKALQCFAAVVGFDQGRREKLDRSNVENIEWHTFDSKEHTHFIYLIALAESNNVNILKYNIENSEPAQGDEDMVKIFEEYANGGFGIIRGWLNKNPGDPFGDKAILVAMEKAGFLQKDDSAFEDVEF